MAGQQDKTVQWVRFIDGLSGHAQGHAGLVFFLFELHFQRRTKDLPLETTICSNHYLDVGAFILFEDNHHREASASFTVTIIPH